NVRSYFGTFSYPAALDMSLAREEDGQEFEEPGLIIYDIKQNYVGQVREVSPRIGKRITREFPVVRSLCHALQEYLPDSQIVYAQGVNCAGSDVAGMEEALRAAADADAVILTLGGKNGWGITSTVGEGVDSTDIDLPGRQEEFARRVYELHKKTVVLHFDGRPLSNAYVASHFDAILEVWQPGVMGGQALCKTLFGAYNPGGKLPVTAARNAGQLPVYYGLPRGSGYVAAGHTGMIRNKNGYINDTAYPLYYFGHGLSYTTFDYSDARIDRTEVVAKDIMNISVTVENTGNVAGDEVVQLYFTDQTASMVRPTMELAGFKRISLEPREKKEVIFQMKVSQMAFLDRDNRWVVEKGAVTFSIGSSCADIRQRLHAEVTESAQVDERTRGFYAQAVEKRI
ncbi:MAG: glycoside hydrolase family 3 C-terminal domain-containing protein, partial [Lachnospiraceae bacterium]|nr:glycoside hydrolase family 3 C-terminal domain-containing protein [Lachnospiraceae bacterium]